MASIHDLPPELVGNILTRVPITCLRAVRSTCKSWNSLSKEWVVGEAAARQQQFLGFMTMGSKLYSVRFDLRGIDNDLVEQSVELVDLFVDVRISNALYVDGLVLLATEDDWPSLILWNPYLQQQRSIEPRLNFREQAIGYDENHNLKILGISHHHKPYVIGDQEYVIYDLSSDMYRVVDAITPLDWVICHKTVTTLKGNAYFLAIKFSYNVSLVCFDFTREKFGPRLDVPCVSEYTAKSVVSLSRVSEERLAIFHLGLYDDLRIWVTNKTDPNKVSWNMLFKVEHVIDVQLCKDVSFFFDEEKKVAVVFGISETWGDEPTSPTAYFLREDDNRELDGCFKSVTIGKSMSMFFATPLVDDPPLVSSFYLPSLLQIKR